MTLVLLLVALAVLVWPARHAPPRWRADPSAGLGSVAEPTRGAPGAPNGAAKRARAAAPRRPWGRRGRGQDARLRELAERIEVTAIGLRAGLPAEEAHDLGYAVVTGARRAGDRDPGTDEDTFVAAAWELSEQIGTSLVPACECASAVLRARAAAQARRRALLAGPMASMWVLTALPLVGPAAVLALGVDAASTFGAPVPATLVGCGVVLTGVGWVLARTLLRRAVRPAPVGSAEAGSEAMGPAEAGSEVMGPAGTGSEVMGPAGTGSEAMGSAGPGVEASRPAA